MIRTILLTVLSLGFAAAQPAPVAPFPWWNMPFVRDLNLSDEQNQQMQGVVREFRPKLVDLRAAVEKAEGDLEDIFNEDRVDQRRANDASEKLIAARADLTRALSQMSLRLRTILTADQWKELQKRRHEMRGPGHGPGPGEHGPGPGHPNRRPPHQD
jgi:Spy/CpxP family protein refolding chaperone